MTNCEMCGKDGKVLEVDVEGVEMKVCPGCTKYGVVKKRYDRPYQNKSFQRSNSYKKPQEFRIVPNYAVLIRSEREKRGMSHEDFSKFLNEKESILAKWEQGVLKPRIDIARAIERKLGITLIEKEKDKEFKQEKKKVSDEFTLGDFIKIRKKKN